MSPKKNILVLIDWFWPGYLAGGPVQSVVSLVSVLGKNYHFKIISTNTDLKSKEPYAGIQADTWVQSPLGCEVYYASTLSKAKLKQLLRETPYDLVYINSFFSKFFSIIPLQVLKELGSKKPVIVAPRGMLGEGALALKKWKKKLFIFYAKLCSLHQGVIWHATSEQEASEIKTVFPQATRVVTISNLPKTQTLSAKPPKEKGKLKLCFISRISEKKNLLYALQILAGIREGRISYRIYGPLEDEVYWNLCQEAMKRLPSNVEASYEGSLDPASIEKALSEQHVLFLPTMNENFGHSIVEALQCGCPVIISDQTPWKDLETHRAGFAIDLKHPEKFEAAIKKCLDFSQETFSEWSVAANKYISERIHLDQISDQYKQLFNDPT